ncbi:MAG: glycosyltransferase family 4 protein [Gaiellales bacterium]
MRILLCASTAPLPPTTGLRLVLVALLEQLRGRHEVRVVAFRDPDQVGEPEPDTRLVALPRPSLLDEALAVAGGAVRGRPRHADRLAAALRPALLSELEAFAPDVVHVTAGRIAALGQALAGQPCIVAPLDAGELGIRARADAASGLKRALLRREERLVARFEAEEFARYGRVVVVSDQDADALRSLNPALRVTVIPNGVDCERFAPGAGGPDRDESRLVFTGVMSSPPNVVAAELLAREILPLVRARRPEANLALVGRDPSPRVQALAAEEAVIVTGEVPDVGPWLAGSRVFACPMTTGTGIKNKLLEAMATGLPCVATPLALGGLQVTPGVDLLAAETPAELADAIVRVLDDDALARRLGERARAYVTANHGWRAVADEYVRVYTEVVAGR